MVRPIRALLKGSGPTRFVSVDPTTIEIEARSISGNSSAYIDDISMLYNGRFESELVGIEGWDVVQTLGTTVSRETTNPIAGSGSLKIHVGSDSGGVGVSSWIIPIDSDQHGQEVTLTFLARSSVDANLISYFDYDNASDYDPNETFACTTESQEFEVSLTIPDGASGLSVLIGTHWDGGQDDIDFWLDDIRLVKTADAS